METDELTAILQEVRDRVRARHPAAHPPGGALPDLMPLLHARDAAEAKVAAIGTVNPRAGGPLNWLAQQVKKAIARALDWHVREQVEFNRNVMACVQATLEALEETRRTLAAHGPSECGRGQELKDIRTHWVDWRQEWEHKLVVNETKLLRGLAELNAAFQHRAGLMESYFRDQIKLQHADFEGALDRYGVDIQKRLWADLERIRKDYDHLIHSELRLIRQRFAAIPPAARATETLPPQVQLHASAAAATPIRLCPLRRTFPRLGRLRQEGPAILPAVLHRPARSAGYRLRARRVSGVDARSRRPGARHRPEPGIRGPMPPQGPRRPKPPTCSRIWRICRKHRWMAFSARRWWSICRPNACRR